MYACMYACRVGYVYACMLGMCMLGWGCGSFAGARCSLAHTYIYIYIYIHT